MNHEPLIPALQALSKSPRGNRKLQKGSYHEGMCELDNLFKPIVINNFISFGESDQLVLPRQDALFEHVECFP